MTCTQPHEKQRFEHRQQRVKKISVEVGKMAMVNPEQVIFLFDTIKEDDPLFAAAVLECARSRTADKMSLRIRGNEIYVCPRCGALPELVKGREIVVTNVEIEVED